MDDLATRQFLELERVHWWFEGRRRIFFTLLDHLVETRAGLHILDVGCGVGGMMEELRRYGDPVGLEVDPAMLRRTHERGFEKLVCASAEDLPVRDETFDLITLFDCLEHLPRDDHALAGCLRALRPGGMLFLSVPAWQFLYADNDRVAHHQRRYRRGPLVRQLRRVGFEVRRASYVNSILFPLIVPAVLALKLKQRILRRPQPSTNLSFVPPRALNRLLAGIFGAERHLVRRVDLPLGHSIVVAARRPALATR